MRWNVRTSSTSENNFKKELKNKNNKKILNWGNGKK